MGLAGARRSRAFLAALGSCTRGYNINSRSVRSWRCQRYPRAPERVGSSRQTRARPSTIAALPHSAIPERSAQSASRHYVAAAEFEVSLQKVISSGWRELAPCMSQRWLAWPGSARVACRILAARARKTRRCSRNCSSDTLMLARSDAMVLGEFLTLV